MQCREHEVSITIAPAGSIRGTLCRPSEPRGVVVFAHGTGSSRHHPRNRQAASLLQQNGMATLLVDLLTTEEERRDRWSHQLRFDIPLLGGRLLLSTLWLRRQPDLYDLPIGLFGAGTGAAAAMLCAAHETDRIQAIVSRGGRIDLVGDQELGEVRAPTLVIVGGADVPVLAATKRALPKLKCPQVLEIVPDAAHLFEQQGALEHVARRANEWFGQHLLEQRQAATEPGPSSRAGPSRRGAQGLGLQRH